MHMAATKPWTLEELDRLPEDGNKYELVHGDLLVTPPPSYDHETIASRLSGVIDPYARANGLGMVYRPRAIVRLGGSEVEPDLVVREPAPMGTAWEAAPLPLLVVEVVSPSSRRHDYEVKRTFYADDARIPDYWIVDPEARRITVVNPGRTDAVFEDERRGEGEGGLGSGSLLDGVLELLSLKKKGRDKG